MYIKENTQFIILQIIYIHVYMYNKGLLNPAVTMFLLFYCEQSEPPSVLNAQNFRYIYFRLYFIL